MNVLVVAKKPQMTKIIAAALSTDTIGGDGDECEYFIGFLICILTQIHIPRQSDVYFIYLQNLRVKMIRKLGNTDSQV